MTEPVAGQSTPDPVTPEVSAIGSVPDAPKTPVTPVTPQTPTVPEYLKGITLEADIANDPALRVFKDIPSLVKSYVNAQKIIGANKAIIPTKNSSESEWNDFYNKIGRPESADKYDLGVEAGKETDIQKQFRLAAHKSGLLPQQAKGLSEWFNSQMGETLKATQEAKKVETHAQLTALKTEWAGQYETNMRKAADAAKHFGGPEFIAYLNKSGLGNNPTILKLFAKIGGALREDAFKGETTAGIGMTSGDIQKQINTILNNKDHAYWNAKNKSAYDMAQEEVRNLYSKLNG